MTTPNAPQRLRPLVTATPQDETMLENSLRKRVSLHAERTAVNILPALRTMLYAIPQESRSGSEDQGKGKGKRKAKARAKAQPEAKPAPSIDSAQRSAAPFMDDKPAVAAKAQRYEPTEQIPRVRVGEATKAEAGSKLGRLGIVFLILGMGGLLCGGGFWWLQQQQSAPPSAPMVMPLR